jgi:hypothetical protein
LPPASAADRKSLLRMCPECRRKTDLPRVKFIVQEAFDERL